MSRPIQINTGSNAMAPHAEIRRSESFGNFTPSSWGTPYHHPEIYASSPSQRTRTISGSYTSDNIYQGIIKKFSRTKGHGFIQPNDKNTITPQACSNIPQPKIAQPMVYFHVSDILGELVPKENDPCSYRIAVLPPRDNEKAVEVKLLLNKEKLKDHETWQKSNN